MQPRSIRLANRIGAVLRRRGRFPFPLEADALQSSAIKKTGFDDFGDPSYEHGLALLLDELKDVAQLSPLGQLAAYFNIQDYLCVRLNLIAYRKRRHEVAQQRIEKPLIILGMPRSGTTKLYEMLAQDTANRTPASWEVAIPVPPPTPENYTRDRRIKRVDIQFSFAERLSPGFKAIHAIGARLPQECVYLFASHFLSEQFGYMYNVPEYRTALVDADMTQAYHWHARFLQHLQVDYSAQRWVLKTPSHLAYLSNLLAQYPDATIVWTHRCPRETVPSFASLVSTLRGGFSDAVDPADVGKFEVQQQASIVERGMQQLRDVPDSQICHVSYSKLVDHPMSVVHDIYQHFGFELTGDAEESMRAYDQQRPKELYGAHDYRAEQFAINQQEIDSRFEEYREEFADYLR